MDESGTTWILAANGAAARLFEERTRAGDVREAPSMRMTQSRADRALESSAESERRFLERVAGMLTAAERHRAFDDLVVFAPPEALGYLRRHLGPGVQKRLCASAAHDCVLECGEEIRHRLRALRVGQG
jgi:protein required for attachment to host cells